MNISTHTNPPTIRRHWLPAIAISRARVCVDGETRPFGNVVSRARGFRCVFLEHRDVAATIVGKRRLRSPRPSLEGDSSLRQSIAPAFQSTDFKRPLPVSRVGVGLAVRNRSAAFYPNQRPSERFRRLRQVCSGIVYHRGRTEWTPAIPDQRSRCFFLAIESWHRPTRLALG